MPTASKVLISLRIRAEASSTPEGQACAGTLTEPQPQIDDRLEAEMLEHRARTRFGRAVTGDDIGEDSVAVRNRGEQGCARDHAVDHDRNTMRRAGDDEAGERGDLEPADLGQHRSGDRSRDADGRRATAASTTAILRRNRASSMPGAAPGDVSRPACR